MDFNPEDGDSILLELANAQGSGKKNSAKLDMGGLRVDYKWATIDNVHVDYEGDVEVRFKGRNWIKIAKTGRGNLGVKVKQHGDSVSLRFNQKF